MSSAFDGQVYFDTQLNNKHILSDSKSTFEHPLQNRSSHEFTGPALKTLTSRPVFQCKFQAPLEARSLGLQQLPKILGEEFTDHVTCDFKCLQTATQLVGTICIILGAIHIKYICLIMNLHTSQCRK